MSDVSYTKINWQAYPSKSTKITAQNLGVMDQGIKDCADAINEINTSLSNKVAKAGDTMTGGLTIESANPGFCCDDMNGNTLRRRVWFGMANSSGDFYIYDNTDNRSIIHSIKNGKTNFYGQLYAEKLTVTFAAGAATNKTYWAYKFGNWVYINIRCTWPNAITSGLGLFKLTDSSGNIIKPLVSDTGSAYSQLLNGTYYPRTGNNSNGFNICVDGTASAGSNVQVWGLFMCQ